MLDYRLRCLWATGPRETNCQSVKLQSSSIQKWSEALLERFQFFSDIEVELVQLLPDATTTLKRLDKSFYAVGFFRICAEIPYSLPTVQTESKLVDHAT